MPRIIKCNAKDFKELSVQLINTSKNAGDYCPAMEDVADILKKEPPYDLAYYIRFFLWIILTGTDTEENCKDREYLSMVIAKNIQIVKEEE